MGDNGSSSGGKSAGAWSSSDLHQVSMQTTLTHTTPNESTGATLPPGKTHICNFFAGAGAMRTKTTKASQQPNQKTMMTIVLIRTKTQTAQNHRQRRCTGGQWRREMYFDYTVWAVSYCMRGSEWTGSCKVDCHARTARFTLYRRKPAWIIFKDPVCTAQ